MFSVASILFVFPFALELLAELRFNHTMAGQLGDIKKVCILADIPDHWLSFWMSDNLEVGQNRLITFYFTTNSSRGGAVVDVWPPGPEKLFNVPVITLPFKDYPRTKGEFLYYFTIYNKTLYFTLATSKGVQTVVIYVAEYLTPPPVWMYIVCNNCTESDEIFYSTLNFGKRNSDWRKLDEDAWMLSPYYGNTTEIMDDQTKQILNGKFPIIGF